MFHVRWMIRRDMAEVLNIESLCFEYPWGEEDFIHSLRQKNIIGMVVEHDERVVGFMIYEIAVTRIDVLNFAVHPDFQRQGVGTVMVDKLTGKLSSQRRNLITIFIRETNLDAQLFFRTMGFRWGGTMRRYYDETQEDAYLLEYRFGQPAWNPTNRITKFMEDAR